MLRQISVYLVISVPALSLAQLSINTAAYRLDTVARSGIMVDTDFLQNNAVGPAQTFFRRIDSNASSSLSTPSSTVNSWATVGWNCTPTDLDVELTACWSSFDFGAGNSARMRSRLELEINLNQVSIISAMATFDPPNSSMSIDIWTGSAWAPFVTGPQLVNYSGVWGPGDYLLRTEREYNPVGNSTGCVGYGFHLNAIPLVPEPSSMLALCAGMVLVVGRRKQQSK